MPDDKYEFCGIKFVTGRYSSPALNRPVYTATLEDMQRPLHAAMCAPDWMLKPEEARPQDMAIWRAILVGKEGFVAVPSNVPHAVHMWRRYCLTLNRVPAFRREQECKRAYLGSGFTCYRFILFTHPFTGGRAVFSEPVD